MKQCRYENSISSFYYELKDSNVIIVSQGDESPFEHLDSIYPVLNSFKKKELNVFFDFCFTHGASKNRIMSLFYSNSKFDLKTKKYINENNLPTGLKNSCNRFYKANYKKLIESCYLTDIEINKLKDNLFYKN